MTEAEQRPISLFLVAGEPSGDVLGAKLMAALTDLAGERVRFSGVGGERMTEAGLRSVFPLEDIAVMGFLQVVPHLPVVLRRIRDTVAAIAAARPDVVITIDSPSFSLRVAERARRMGIPVIHYVAPQYWAWRPGRLKKLPRRVDHLMALFPFEPAFFAGSGVATSYVGHPAIEEPAGDGAAFRRRHAIAADLPIVAVLPGSRAHLVDRMLPVFKQAIDVLSLRRAVRVVVPTLDARRARVAAILRGWAQPHTVVDAPGEKRDAIAAAAAALTVSGTITTELVVAQLPMVVGYRVDEISAYLVRWLATVRYAAMPNLILDRDMAPEFLQENCTPDRLAAAMEPLLSETPERAAQRAGLAEAARLLGVGGERPARRAARTVLDFVERRRRTA